MAIVGILAAVIIAVEWYAGKPADAPTLVLAILGALYVGLDALERAFPQLRD